MQVRTLDRLYNVEGDHSYALGFAWIWEYFFKNIAAVANTIPYMVSIGNHEYDHVSGGKKDPSGAPGNGFHVSSFTNQAYKSIAKLG
jgi:hypothetical protein